MNNVSLVTDETDMNQRNLNSISSPFKNSIPSCNHLDRIALLQDKPMKTIADMQKELADIAAFPPEDARSLPGYFYTSPEYFQYEVDNILSREWHCLGRLDEIVNPGDYFTTNLLGEPLIIVRGDNDDVKVLSNVCRHRSMPLVNGKGNVRRFVCSYHAWSYNRDGKLANAPRIPKNRIVGDTCDLTSFPCETWNGFIYTNLDHNAEGLAPRLENLDRLVKVYEGDKFHLIYQGEEVWNTNWKCLIENFMEAYHLSVVHPGTLHPYTPSGLSKKSMADGAFTSYCANYPANVDRRGMGARGLTEEERHRSTLFCLFPTQLVSQAANLLVSMSVQPLGPEKLNVRWTMSTYGDNLDANAIKERIALWQEVNQEDRMELEKLQVSLSSRTSVSGPLAPPDYEGTIWDFYQYLAAKLPVREGA